MTEEITVLIADDNIDDRLSLKDLLVGEGYAVLEARNTDETFKQATANIPDLIILDVEMPTEDGYAVCKRLRGFHRTANIPVLMLTCHGFVDERTAGLNSGADDYLIKPCDNTELLARMSALFRRYPPKARFIDVIQHAQRSLDAAEKYRQNIVVLNVDVKGSSIAPLDTNEEFRRTLTFHDYHSLVEDAVAACDGSKVAWAGDGGTSEFSTDRSAVSSALLILENCARHHRVSNLILRIGIAGGIELIEPRSEIGKRTSQTHNRAGHLQKYSNENKATIGREIYDALSEKSQFQERSPIDGAIVYESK
jgi:DNA-binding response OmpR family regulator